MCIYFNIMICSRQGYICVCVSVRYSLSPLYPPILPLIDQHCYSLVLALASSLPYTVTNTQI